MNYLCVFFFLSTIIMFDVIGVIDVGVIRSIMFDMV